MAMDDRDWLQFGVVYFGNSWYAENMTSSHHVANRLARLTPVLYLDSPGMRAPVSYTHLDVYKRQQKQQHRLW